MSACSENTHRSCNTLLLQTHTHTHTLRYYTNREHGEVAEYAVMTPMMWLHCPHSQPRRENIKVWEIKTISSSVIIKSFKASPVTVHAATWLYFPAVPKETHLAAHRVSRKDKFTDDGELWPHAISRHQSGDSTILGLGKAWPEVASTLCRSRRCSLSQYTADRIEWTLQTKNTNAWKFL